jgi:hypothetical protein
VIVDLRGGRLDWRAVPIPAASPLVRLARLHVDAASRATVSVVEFPPGWSRAQLGHYGCAEEFVVLDGSLVVSGVRYAAGDYAYLPPRVPRSASRSETGCLTVAWFSGPIHWYAGRGPSSTEPPRALRLPVADASRPEDHTGGTAYGASAAPADPAPTTTDLLWPGAARWCLVPAGATPPPVDLAGPVLIRRWSQGVAGCSQSPVP